MVQKMLLLQIFVKQTVKSVTSGPFETVRCNGSTKNVMNC